jgi:hypothetical protein
LMPFCPVLLYQNYTSARRQRKKYKNRPNLS